MSRIYMDDCICPGCANCDIGKDLCKIDRMRYPTDGCFDFVSKDDPSGDNVLSRMLKIIKDHNERRNVMGNRDLISAENVSVYIKAGGEYCPYCKSPEVEQDSMLVYDEETSMVYRNMACLTCFREWTDLFKLYDVKPMVK